MQSFDFKVVLDQVEIDKGQADTLYAHCKDGMLITADGKSYVDFDRRATSLVDAVRTAIADVNAAGFRAKRVEIDADAIAAQHV